VAPLSPQILAEIDKKNMSKESPILVRLFKEESELEVWKETQDGTYALLKTYPICRWSGELGPKVKTGDRQAPEGFYAITPGLMNPNSQYYLAINTGFPNAYDKANDRTGNFLMIHGDCSSAGCYAMTDEQISEIYALARESFFGGQRAFQIQAYPFKMTALNMARHRNSPHMPFWRMIKQGYDHFEVSRLEPKINVCEKRYVFDAESKGRFDPTAKCPAYTVNEDLVAAVKEKQQNDDRVFAELVNKGTATVPARIGKDGGMHDVFLATMKPASGDGAGGFRAPWAAPLPGTIPSHATAPGDPKNPAVTVAGVPAVGTTYVRSPPPGRATLVVRTPEPTPSVLRTAEPTPSVVRAPEPAPSVVRAAEAPTGSIRGDPFRTGRLGAQTAAAQPSSSSSSFFGSLFSNETAPEPSSRGIEPADTKTPAVRLPPPKPAALPQAAAKPATNANASAARPAVKPDPTANARADKPEPKSKAADNSVLSGAQAPLPAAGFENRFGAWR
jgi:murein L,D-transpeptidase YafK